jgi:hypothetical protein
LNWSRLARATGREWLPLHYGCLRRLVEKGVYKATGVPDWQYCKAACLDE